jgi:hypothetical protein
MSEQIIYCPKCGSSLALDPKLQLVISKGEPVYNCGCGWASIQGWGPFGKETPPVAHLSNVAQWISEHDHLLSKATGSNLPATGETTGSAEGDSLAGSTDPVVNVPEGLVCAVSDFLLEHIGVLDYGRAESLAKVFIEWQSTQYKGWECFHCGEVFTTPGAAEDHFGGREKTLAACQIKAGNERGLLMALRKLEKALSGIRTVASGEMQVAEDDTAGMAWIDSFAQKALSDMFVVDVLKENQ